MFDIIDPRTIPYAWAWATSTTWCRINSTCACPILRTHSSVVRASFVCDFCDVISLVHSLPPVCADKNSNVEMSSSQAPRDESWRLLACSFAVDANAQGSHGVCFVVRTGDAHYVVAPCTQRAIYFPPWVARSIVHVAISTLDHLCYDSDHTQS